MTVLDYEDPADPSALMFRSMKRDAVRWTAQQNAELEYQSWFPVKGRAT